LPNKRDLELDKYGISKHRYRELKSFCLQYNEWKDKLKYQTDAVKGQQITGMPFSGGVSNSTQCLAMLRAELEKNCEVVEQTMIEAITTLKKGNTSKYLYDGDYQDIYDHMIKAVTNDDISYTYLDQVMNIPIGRDSFYKLRRYFYFLLDKTRT
jgi:hypothetical protein